MPSRNGPSGISRAITPEQERLLEETWSSTHNPTQDELVLLQRQSGLSAAKVYFIVHVDLNRIITHLTSHGKNILIENTILSQAFLNRFPCLLLKIVRHLLIFQNSLKLYLSIMPLKFILHE